MVGILDGASDTVGVLLGLVGTTTGFMPPPTTAVVVGKLDGASDGIVVMDGLAVGGGGKNKVTVGESDGASEGDKEGSADDDATRVFAVAADDGDNGDDPRMVDGVMDGCCGTASVAEEAAL